MFNSERTCRVHRSAEFASLPRAIPRRSKYGCDFALNKFGCIIRIKLSVHNAHPVQIVLSLYPVYTARLELQAGVIFTHYVSAFSIFKELKF